MSKITKEIKNVIRDLLRLFLTPIVYNKIRFVIVHHYYPDLIHPRTFSEKIFSRKFDKKFIFF